METVSSGVSACHKDLTIFHCEPLNTAWMLLMPRTVGFSVGCFADFVGAPEMRDVAVLIDRVLDLVLIESFAAAFCDPRNPVVDGEDMRRPLAVLSLGRRG